QRLKDVVSTFQVVFSVLVFTSYYLGPTLLRSEWVQELHIESTPATWLLPPVWIASLQQLVVQPLSVWLSVLALLGVLAPVVSMWLVVRIFAAGFNDKLATLAGGSSNDGVAKEVWPTNAAKQTLGYRLGKLLCRS